MAVWSVLRDLRSVICAVSEYEVLREVLPCVPCAVLYASLVLYVRLHVCCVI